MLLFYSFVYLRIDSKGILFSWCYSLREDLNTLYRQLWQVSYGLLAEWCIPSNTTQAVYLSQIDASLQIYYSLYWIFCFWFRSKEEDAWGTGKISLSNINRFLGCASSKTFEVGLIYV